MNPPFFIFSIHKAEYSYFPTDSSLLTSSERPTGRPAARDGPMGPLVHSKPYPSNYLHQHSNVASQQSPAPCRVPPIAYTCIPVLVAICMATLPSHIPLHTPTIVLQQAPMLHILDYWRPLLSHILSRNDHLQRVPDARHLRPSHITIKRPSTCTSHSIDDRRHPHLSRLRLGNCLHRELPTSTCVSVYQTSLPPQSMNHIPHPSQSP